MAETTSADHLEVEIDSFTPHRTSIDQIDASLQTQNTWIISVFVVIHLAVFAITMNVNNCPQNSDGDCIFGFMGSFSFEPLKENPLLGPSSSTLNKMGALQRKLVFEQHQLWRLITSPWLHAGTGELFSHLWLMIFIGIHLEQEFGSWRIGIIYTLSAFVGSLMAALFVNYNPAVASSGAIFGLIGAFLANRIRNWRVYTHKYLPLAMAFALMMDYFVLCWFPYLDNFSNMGGLVSGILLGFMLFYNLDMGLKHKFDRPVMRSICLALFSLILSGGIVGVLHGVNANEYCIWCFHLNCFPFEGWHCK